jgi:hypothetical protein
VHGVAMPGQACGGSGDTEVRIIGMRRDDEIRGHGPRILAGLPQTGGAAPPGWADSEMWVSRDIWR